MRIDPALVALSKSKICEKRLTLSSQLHQSLLRRTKSEWVLSPLETIFLWGRRQPAGAGGVFAVTSPSIHPSDILALKHVGRIFGHCNNPALPFCPVCGYGISSCSVLKYWLEKEKQEVLGCCNVRILLPCFRAKISVGRQQKENPQEILQSDQRSTVHRHHQRD